MGMESKAEELRGIQEIGVMGEDIKGLKFIIRYPVDSSLFSSLKLKIKFEGED